MGSSRLNLREKTVILSDLTVLEAELAKRSGYKFGKYFPDEGPLRRELYIGAMEFFRAGVRYPERLLLGGNRVGKTEDAAYEITCHMTGRYPPWWEGRRFDHPIEGWAAGDTATTTRDIQQLALYGQIPSAPKTGFLPAHLITHAPPKNSIPHAIESVYVKHISGKDSYLQFKSYDQRREAFQGTAKHIIWLDEECPEDVYVECLMRTLTCNGIIMVTFTPVEGLTPFVESWLKNSVFLPNQGKPDPVTGKLELLPAEAAVLSLVDDDDEADIAAAAAMDGDKKNEILPLDERQKVVSMISWDEVPHLSPAARQQMLSSIPEYQRNARTRGIPALGSGAIYPVAEEEIKEDIIQIPPHWPRGFGMDVGWNWTVALWGAYDPDTGIWHIYHEHYRSHAEPPVHAEGIKAVGNWIPGRIDPAANGRSQVDGKQLLQLYLDLGLNIDMAPNGVEAGIFEVWTLITAGKIRVRRSLRHFFTEYRMYRRDKKGRVVKKNDHLMDAMRYMVASGVDWLARMPVADVGFGSSGIVSSPNSWMS